MLSEPPFCFDIFLPRIIENFSTVKCNHIYSPLQIIFAPEQIRSSHTQCSTKLFVKKINEHFEFHQGDIECLKNGEKSYCTHVVKYVITPLNNLLNKWKVCICQGCSKAQDHFFFGEYQILFERFQGYVESNNNKTRILHRYLRCFLRDFGHFLEISPCIPK